MNRQTVVEEQELLAEVVARADLAEVEGVEETEEGVEDARSDPAAERVVQNLNLRL